MEKNLFTKIPFKNQDIAGPDGDFYKNTLSEKEKNEIEKKVDEHLVDFNHTKEMELEYKPMYEVLEDIDSQEVIARGLRNKQEILGFPRNTPEDLEGLLRKFEINKQARIDALENEYAEIKRKTEIISRFYNDPTVIKLYNDLHLFDSEIEKLLDGPKSETTAEEIENLREKKNIISDSITKMMPPECESKQEMQERMEELHKEHALLVNYVDPELQ